MVEVQSCTSFMILFTERQTSLTEYAPFKISNSLKDCLLVIQKHFRHTMTVLNQKGCY